VSYTGVLELSAVKKQQKTIVSSCYYEGAMKITRPVYLEKHLPSIYLIHVGGGYVDGDKYLTNVTVEVGAELAITTQSSTKVYKTPKVPVVQQSNFILKKSSILEYLPDPLIAYEGARFIQETIVHMEDESCFLYSDIITPGWAEDGSFFSYHWIRSKLKVYKNERLIIFDHLLLEPDAKMNGMLQMDGCTHVGMFLIVHNEAGKDFLDHLYETLKDTYSEVRFGLSLLPESGVILRILARNTGVIEKMIAYAHTIARRELLGKDSVTWRKY
jgi:urease accessory protein